MQHSKSKYGYEKVLHNQKAEVDNACRELQREHNRVRSLISDLFSEVNRKHELLNNERIDPSQKPMLKYDYTLTQKELEKAIYQKEILRKDITILQKRLNYIENEIRKSKPWWQKLFMPVR
jgi:hypothetical protein